MNAESMLLGLQRANTVKVKAQDETGAKVSLSLTDWQARIFQHEYDHLQVSQAFESQALQLCIDRPLCLKSMADAISVVDKLKHVTQVSFLAFCLALIAEHKSAISLFGRLKHATQVLT